MQKNISSEFKGKTAQAFANHGETVRGQIRYELVKRNLGSLVTGPNLLVADIGGGSAIDAIWLAGLGHQVIVAEPAEDQLARARKRIGHENESLARRISLRKESSRDLLENGEGGSYDLVLSHGVAMYLPDPAGFIGELVELAKPGGYVSLLEKGFYGAQAARIREQKYAEALSLSVTGKFLNHMGKNVTAFFPEQLEAIFSNLGMVDLAWSGIRVNRDADYRLVNDVSEDEMAQILDEELNLGLRPDTKGLGQMLHFIGRKAEE